MRDRFCRRGLPPPSVSSPKIPILDRFKMLSLLVVKDQFYINIVFCLECRWNQTQFQPTPALKTHGINPLLVLSYHLSYYSEICVFLFVCITSWISGKNQATLMRMLIFMFKQKMFRKWNPSWKEMVLLSRWWSAMSKMQ